jgi:hypothetical protein
MCGGFVENVPEAHLETSMVALHLQAANDEGQRMNDQQYELALENFSHNGKYIPYQLMDYCEEPHGKLEGRLHSSWIFPM